MLNTKEGKGEGEGFNPLVFFSFIKFAKWKITVFGFDNDCCKKKINNLALRFLPFWPLLFDTKEKIFRCDF